MSAEQHPYRKLPESAFWRRSVAGKDYSSVDPVSNFRLSLSPDTKVATAGSCFAQHIARHLTAAGLNFYVTEPGHPLLSQHTRTKHGFGVYSARYGNIYTARQLTQLFRRAYGHLTPREDIWVNDHGVVRDPFRPTVQPGGFISESEMRRDREQHLAAVRKMFESLDVFVFTMGLTECWVSRLDGAVFPLCPGVDGGSFHSDRYMFYNQTVDDVVADMTRFIDDLKIINSSAQIILTVSPVPLAATAEPESHVLGSTTYSKSVLRVASEQLQRRFKHVQYFPSYEIVTGAYNRGRYYAEDLRSVTEEGVSHVMQLFIKYTTKNRTEDLELTDDKAPPISKPSSSVSEDALRASARLFVEVECDEVRLDSQVREQDYKSIIVSDS